MKSIDKSELKRILELKNRYDNNEVDIDTIGSEDIEILNLLYEIDIDNTNLNISNIKKEIDSLYVVMQDMIEKVENNKKN